MSGFRSSRRFIAGAVCPRCSAMDRIVVDMDTERRECVACGFSDERPGDHAAQDAAQNTAQEVPTRVSRASARRVETPAEAVTLVDPSAEPASDDDR